MDEQSFDQLLKSALSHTPEQLADPRAPEPHPEPDVLQRHHARELDAAQSQQVQEHIEACASCARQFLDFDVPPPIDPRDESFDTRAGWERLRGDLALVTPPQGSRVSDVVVQPAAPSTGGRRRPQSVSRFALPLAAGLVVGFGLSPYLRGARSETPGSALQARKALSPRGDTADRRTVVTSTVGPDTLYVVLSVGKNQGEVPLQYDIQLVRAGDDAHMPLQRWNQVFSEPEAELVVVPIPRNVLSAGDYELHVRRATDSTTTPPNVYRLAVSGRAHR